MKFLIYCILNIGWKAGIIQHNIFRNRKLGNDPQSSKWHWWQGFSYAFATWMVLPFEWRAIFFELPLTALFWIFFQGFNNTRTFKRKWWYLPTDKAGSAIDRFFLRFRNPVRMMQVAQLSALGASFLPMVVSQFAFKITIF